MPRPTIVGQPDGLIKALVDAQSDQIVGATLLCVDAQEVINLVALAMRAGLAATQLRESIWTHPSTTEGFNEVLTQPRPLADPPTDRTDLRFTTSWPPTRRRR